MLLAGDAIAPVGTRSRAIRRRTSKDGDASRFARFSRSKAGRFAYIAEARMLKHPKEAARHAAPDARERILPALERLGSNLNYQHFPGISSPLV